MREKLSLAVQDCISAVAQLQHPNALLFMEKTAQLIADAFRAEKKVLIAGNGGSLCDACHFAEELTGQFRLYRPALPAIALADAAHLTCTANDMGFDHVFSRAVEAYGKAGDVFIGLTTSGKSPNIIKAFATAKERGLKTIAFLGKGGGALKGVADLEISIDGFATSDRIQEAHMTAMHLIIELIEQHLFPELGSPDSSSKALASLSS